MNDREYLELAAKAAGLTLGKHTQKDWAFTYGGKEWNPLTDDGDALRLAVKLAVLVGTFKLLRLLINSLRQEKGKHNDPLAATRRAIVRAAAEIGKGLRPFPTAKEIREEWI